MRMRAISALAAVSLVAAISSPPAHADKTGEAIGAAAAVLAIIGVAALAHHNDHYRDGWKPESDRETADFERGYRDGLHNDGYHGRYGHDSRAYGEGYAAGQKERDNRLAHKRWSDRDGPNAPSLSMRACVGEASASWNHNPHDIHVVNTSQVGGNDFLVEVAAGHKHGTCEVSSSGQIYIFRNGRI